MTHMVSLFVTLQGYNRFFFCILRLIRSIRYQHLGISLSRIIFVLCLHPNIQYDIALWHREISLVFRVRYFLLSSVFL